MQPRVRGVTSDASRGSPLSVYTWLNRHSLYTSDTWPPVNAFLSLLSWCTRVSSPVQVARSRQSARLLSLQEGELPVQVQGSAHRSGIMLQSSSVTWPSFPQLYLRRGGEVVEVAERLVEGGLVTRERAVARAVATGEVVARAYYRPG